MIKEDGDDHDEETQFVRRKRTSSTTGVGTMLYAAPEQLNGGLITDKV